MKRDAVLAAFVSDYGSQEVLARPIDRGFHRLLWLFPYLLGGTTAVGGRRRGAPLVAAAVRDGRRGRRRRRRRRSRARRETGR